MIKVFADKQQVAIAAAQLFLKTAVSSVAQNGHFLVALSGGSTPAALFTLLAKRPYVDHIPWQQTHVFWSDERLVPPHDDGSNYKQANELLLKHAPISQPNIHRAKGELPPAQAVKDYQNQLQTLTPTPDPFPSFDLILLGMGNDGHTASLFPGPISQAEKTEPIIAITADYDGRPAQRITFTPKLINQGKIILLLVTGESKAQTLNNALNGKIDLEKWPIQRVKPVDGEQLWYLDQSAASHLNLPSAYN